MTVGEGVLLGVVQGLTEFLPISSSAHLLLAQELLGINAPGLRLELAAHVGTLGSVIVHYRRDLATTVRETVLGGPARRVAWLVFLGSLPLVLAVLGRKLAPALRDSPTAAAVGLVAVGLFLLATARAPHGTREPLPRDALVVGLAQAVSAFWPGVSRSGSTIGTGLFRGVAPAEAARFSFLLSVPAILGASLLLALDEGLPTEAESGAFAAAAVVSFAVGLAAIRALLGVLARGRLAWFGPYCVAVGAAALVWLALRG